MTDASRRRRPDGAVGRARSFAENESLIVGSGLVTAVSTLLVGLFLGLDTVLLVLLPVVLVNLALVAALAHRQRATGRTVRDLHGTIRGVSGDARPDALRGDLRRAVGRSDRRFRAVDRRMNQLERMLTSSRDEQAMRASQLTGDAVARLVREQHYSLEPPAGERNAGGSAAPSRADLRGSYLFDEAWYLDLHPDAAADPVAHLIESATRWSHDPHPLFHSEWYRRRYPESAGWETPLAHFLQVGAAAGHDPHPLFWSRWYADRYLDDDIAVRHFLTEGARLGNDPNPLFDVSWYREQHERWLKDPDQNPLIHYLTEGAGLGLDPSPSVDIVDLSERVASGTRDALTAFFERPPDAAAVTFAPPLSTYPGPDRAQAAAKWDYLARRVWQQPSNVVLYRIIGNDLPPRHRPGQSLDNVRFILEHEEDLPGCEKRWVLNRITDPEQEDGLVRVLEEHGQEYLRIPFDAHEYRATGWRFEDFERHDLMYGDGLETMDGPTREVALDHVYHDKNLYIMNNNGARNAALREGRRRGTWVLPWDGNCFLTEEGYAELRAGLGAAPHAKYVVVPMARIMDNDLLRRHGFHPEASQEPQLAFRYDAIEEFDEDSRYGRRPKVELFYRLGVEGPWDPWIDLPWERDRPALAPEARQFVRAGWVARLFSGEGESERDLRTRGARRARAIRTRIDEVDQALLEQTYQPMRLLGIDEEVLERQRLRSDQDPALAAMFGKLKEAAEAVAVPDGEGPHPSVEVWPALSGDLWILAAASHVLPDERAGERGAALARLLCAGADVDASASDAAPPARPVSAYHGLGHTLDAIRLLERGGYLREDDLQLVLAWAARHRTWLREGDEPTTTRAALDHRGTWYEVQLAAVSAYLGDVVELLAVFRRAEERLLEQIDRDGYQRHEIREPDALRRSTYNMQGWATLASFGDRLDLRLWDRGASDGRGLEHALRWLLPFRQMEWPFLQDAPFDSARLDVLGHHISRPYNDVLVAEGVELPDPMSLPTEFDPATGIRPFWQLGLPAPDGPEAGV